MGKVFVVQNPMKRDPDTGEWISKYDLRAAEAFGEIVILLPAHIGPPVPEIEIAALTRGLSEFTSEDYLLPIGPPAQIGLAFHLALVANGMVRILQWNRTRVGTLVGGRYVEIVYDLNKALANTK